MPEKKIVKEVERSFSTLFLKWQNKRGFFLNAKGLEFDAFKNEAGAYLLNLLALWLQNAIKIFILKFFLYNQHKILTDWNSNRLDFSTLCR